MKSSIVISLKKSETLTYVKFLNRIGQYIII
jgi:hypothetical protein